MVRRVFVFVDRYQHRKFPVTIGIIVSIEAAVNLAVPLKVKGVPRPLVNFRLIFSLIRYRYSLASRATCSPRPPPIFPPSLLLSFSFSNALSDTDILRSYDEAAKARFGGGIFSEMKDEEFDRFLSNYRSFVEFDEIGPRRKLLAELAGFW